MSCLYGILHMTPKVPYSLLTKSPLQMGNALKKCKVLLKDAVYIRVNLPQL